MDFHNKRHERGSNWTDPEIVELLQLWSDESVQFELESSLRNQRVFDRIANILREKGIHRTGDQCREKVKKMKLEYRRIKDNHKMRSWKFYDVMDRVLANRPSISYSTLGGALIAQQVFQTPPGSASDTYLPGAPVSSFAPVNSGGFLFGSPAGSAELLNIKCEDVEDGLLDSGGVAPPATYDGSGGDAPETEHSGLEPEEALGQGEPSESTIISPSGFSDLNIAGNTVSTKPSTAGSVPDTAHQARRAGRQRKRRHAAAGSLFGGRAGGSGGQAGLDHALSRFLSWQQTAEERLLSLEEARMEREARAEERREHQEERRAELERRHELRLLGVFAGALAAVRNVPGDRAAASQQDSSPSPPAQGSASLGTTAAATPTASSSLSRAPSEEPSAQQQAPSDAERRSPATASRSGKAFDATRGILPTLRGAETPATSAYLSNRGNRIRQHRGVLQEGYIKYHADKYHDEDNPNGVINMGTSENKLCFDLLHDRLSQPDMLHNDPSLLQYPDWQGHSFLRKAVANFLSHYCDTGRPLSSDNVVVMNGCGSVFAAIAAVICDPEEAILIPTPFYGVITEDVHMYSGVTLFHVPLECDTSDVDEHPFHLTVEKLEEGLKRAQQKGVVVRAVILVNPHNPLANVYTLREMTGFLEFAKKHELHAIVDEVYMLSVFDESVTFRSVLSMGRLPDPQRTHVMWGLSKDFAMAGIRVGTLYTENGDLVEALDQLAPFHGVPGPTQHQVSRLLQDRDWISTTFLPENRRRMKAAHGYVSAELCRMGIPYLQRPAGFYVWADLRKYLLESSFEEELSLWRVFLRHKVLLSCGQAFSCSSPGWFRIVFTDQRHRLELGMKRIGAALRDIKDHRVKTDLSYIKEAIEETMRSVTEDSAWTDNTAIVSPAPSSPNRSSDPPKEADGPLPSHGTRPDAEDPVSSLDRPSAKPTQSLDALIGVLKQQIRSSDWLERNTPELSAGEDPEVLDVFTDLLQRVRQ